MSRVIAENRDANGNWELEVLVPGYAKSDIAVSVTPCTTRQGSLLKIEMENERYGKELETILLPAAVDLDSINAQAINGILYIQLTKSQKYSSRTIAVM